MTFNFLSNTATGNNGVSLPLAGGGVDNDRVQSLLALEDIKPNYKVPELTITKDGIDGVCYFLKEPTEKQIAEASVFPIGENAFIVRVGQNYLLIEKGEDGTPRLSYQTDDPTTIGVAMGENGHPVVSIGEDNVRLREPVKKLSEHELERKMLEAENTMVSPKPIMERPKPKIPGIDL